MGHSIPEPDACRVGIRSFLRWAENLEDDTDAMLDLLQWFNGRSIRFPELWQQQIYPAVEGFLSRTLRPGQRCHIHLHTHASIAFAAGYCLDSKSGIDVAVIQSTRPLAKVVAEVLWGLNKGDRSPVFLRSSGLIHKKT